MPAVDQSDDVRDVIDTSVQPVGLRTLDDSGLVSCASRTPRLRWQLEAQRDGVRQRAYEVEIASDATFARRHASSGRVVCHKVIGAAWPGEPLQSREVVWCRVRVWTERGRSHWSAPLRIEGSLYEPPDWLARPISPLENVARVEPGPVPLLRHTFDVDRLVKAARLYVSALGTWACWINGTAVSPDLLEPGWTCYDKRHLFAVHDITALLASGENVIAAAIGDGWWRGYLTWTMQRAVYGDTTALLAQIEVEYEDGERRVIATGDDWKGGFGEIVSADIYNGCEIDQALAATGWKLPGYADEAWSPASVLPMVENLEQRGMPPVRVRRVIPVEIRPGPQGILALDCGENTTGFLRLTVRAKERTTIRVRHAEVLEDDGRLHTAALRQAKATDIYHVLPGEHVLEPAFTYHGFRYAEIDVEGAAEILAAEACLLSSDLTRIGRFSCSDPLVNRLADNILRSQRGNFIALPTDCPQRDERLGWTGDIQVFAPTACANLDSRAFLANWLVDLAIAQGEDGQVPSVVPNVINGHAYEFGGVGWADAAVLVPWALYEAYGDVGILAHQFGSMRALIDWGASRLNGQGVWVGDFHLGDWLDPNAPPDHPEEATTDRDFIASAYLAYGASVVSRAAGVLGRDEDAARYADLSRETAVATWEHWRTRLVETQTGCALAIVFGIAPPDAIDQVGASLARLVTETRGRVSTGFLGTPLLLPALTMAGRGQEALRVLLNRESPGWLYQVINGATTMWERWDAILPDGSICKGDMAAEDAESMISFNHYAYGSVGAWLYRSLAGIAPDADDPGYATIRFCPSPATGMDWAEASIDTPYGRASIRWDVTGDTFAADLVVPTGAQGKFKVPAGWQHSGNLAATLRSGAHRVLLNRV